MFLRFLKILLFMVSTSFSSILLAQIPLNFPAEFNSIQILPQKFEYTLLDSSSIKLGDIIIDSKTLNLNLELNPNNFNEGRFLFSWPAGLLKEGELLIFNNNGKSIFSRDISKEKIKIVSGEKNSNSLIRNEISLFTTEYLDEELIEEIKYLPFFKFCVVKKERITKIELCSSELYVSTENDKLRIKERKTNPQNEAKVIINGKEAGDQGIVFLNAENENLNFKAQSESGALLEIVTRLQQIHFNDVIITSNRNFIKLKASGSFPVNETGVKRLGPDSWEITLPIEFPVFYVQGEGGIPMRQEFNIKGPLPHEKLRSYAVGSPKTKTYSSEATIEGRLPKGAIIKSKEDTSEVSLKNKQNFLWTLKKLNPSSWNHRNLTVLSGESEATIGYDIFRGYRNDFLIKSELLTPINLINLSMEFSSWLNDLSSGLSLKYLTAISKPPNITKYSNIDFSYIFRPSKGINFIDPSFFLGFSYKILQLNDSSFSLPGVLLGDKRKPTSYWYSMIADWYQWKLEYFIGQKVNSIDLKSIMLFEFTNFYSLTSNQYLNYSLGFLKYQIDSESESDSESALAKNQLMINLGWNRQF
jgi:hypothetical protein